MASDCKEMWCSVHSVDLRIWETDAEGVRIEWTEERVQAPLQTSNKMLGGPLSLQLFYLRVA